MPRWPAGLHPQAGSGTPAGFRFRRQHVVPIGRFGPVLSGIPLNDGQGQTTIGSNGTGIIQIGPQGLGTVWYPAAVTVSTTSGVNDNSVANVYASPAGNALTATNLLGTIASGGGGVLAAAVPPLPVGWYLTVLWTGGKQGDTAGVNVTGSKDAWGIM